MNTWMYLFLIGAFTKQFYILPSGLLQIGDIFMILSVIGYASRNQLKIAHVEKYLIIFICCAMTINGIYALLYENFVFYKYSVYFIFNLIIVIAFRTFAKSKSFLVNLRKVFKANIITQIAIYLSGKGRWYDANRYKGTFNDPNQYGYFLLMSIAMVLLIDILLHQKKSVVWVVIATITIAVSGSTGMTGACALLLIITVWDEKIRHLPSKMATAIIILFLAFLVLFILVGNQFGRIFLSEIKGGIEPTTIISRLSGKLSKFSEGSLIWSIAEDRSMTKVLKYPWMMIYGAGEGMYERILPTEGNEVHSTMIALLFYYGIIPYTFFITWIRKNLTQNKKCIPIMCVLILEAFTIINHRQPFFWMSFVLAGTVLTDENITSSSEK